METVASSDPTVLLLDDTGNHCTVACYRLPRVVLTILLFIETPVGRKGAFESLSLIRNRNQTNQLQTKLLLFGHQAGERLSIIFKQLQHTLVVLRSNEASDVLDVARPNHREGHPRLRLCRGATKCTISPRQRWGTFYL